jgi:hypothetical protein
VRLHAPHAADRHRHAVEVAATDHQPDVADQRTVGVPDQDAVLRRGPLDARAGTGGGLRRVDRRRQRRQREALGVTEVGDRLERQPQG